MVLYIYFDKEIMNEINTKYSLENPFQNEK